MKKMNFFATVLLLATSVMSFAQPPEQKRISMRASDPDLMVVSPSSSMIISLINDSYTYGRTITVVNKGSATVTVQDTSATPATIRTVPPGTSQIMACTAALCGSASDWSSLGGALDEESGTVSVTFTGPWASSQAKTLTYTRTGRLVTMHIPAVFSACNTTTGTATISSPLPTSLRPSLTFRNSVVSVADNATNIVNPGVAQVHTNGNMTIYINGRLGLDSWTANGSDCGWEQFSISYQL